MGVFEYIGVLVSVIMGLGITHLAAGMSKLIQHRDEVRFYLPHALWTVNILIYILMIWWGMFWWSANTDWYAYEYLFITLYSVVLFLLASMLYPWDMDRNIDVRSYFFRNRTWFFGILFVAWLIDIPETFLKAAANLREAPDCYFVFVGVHLLTAATGMATRNHVVHILLPIFFLVFTVSYVFLSSIGYIGS